MDNVEQNKKTRDPLFIIQKIKEGVIDPEKDDITAEERRDCIETLKLEGQAHASIARFLKCDVKTIRRDLKAIWKNNAEAPSHETNLVHIAEFLEKARANYDHQVRLSNSKEGEHVHKVEAARAAGEALRDMVKMLQSLGYLPKEAMKVEGDIRHHQFQYKDPAQLKENLARLEKILVDEGLDTPGNREKLESYRREIKTLELNQTIGDFENQIAQELARKKAAQDGNA